MPAFVKTWFVRISTTMCLGELQMTQSAFFRKLKAPLKNVRWSWGAKRSDGAVFLRIWKDHICLIEDTRCARVTYHKPHDHDARRNPGHRERLEHVLLIQNGARCYLLMCEATDEKSVPRKIKSFNEETVFQGGRVVDHDGEQWVEILPGIPMTQAILMRDEGCN